MKEQREAQKKALPSRTVNPNDLKSLKNVGFSFKRVIKNGRK